MTSKGAPDRGSSGQTETTIIGTAISRPFVRKIRLERTVYANVVRYRRVADGEGDRRYSRKLKDIQRVEGGFTDAAHRISNAIERGLKTYRKSRNKSAGTKKDGAIKDALDNWSKGFGAFARSASDAPLDITRKINRKRLVRIFRNTLPMMMAGPFR